jgi:hypothetical protein
MPQPIQGPTLADVATNVVRREKELKAKGQLSPKKLAELRAAQSTAGATKREQSRQRAIAKEIAKYGTGAKGAPSTRRRNALFNESGRIARRARKRIAEREAAAVKKAAATKKKAAAKKKAAKKVAKKAVKKTARPAKKAAKKVAKKAAPVKKAAKKSR